MPNPNHETISRVKSRLQELEQEKMALLADLRQLEEIPPSEQIFGTPLYNSIPNTSEERISLFCKLFANRNDVFPKRWENKAKGLQGYSPVCGNEWVRDICKKPQVKCSKCSHRVFTPFDEQTARAHLEGQFTAGTYAIGPNDNCIFLAADFDGKTWSEDALSYQVAGIAMGIDIGLERSRSGNGAHAWVFFSDPISAKIARQLGTIILSNARAKRHNISLDSYDRFFPSQDTLPNGGFGNLIALPLQRLPRKDGNSVFIDASLIPFPDQWAFLASIRRLSYAEIATILDRHCPQKDIPALSDTEEIEIINAEAPLDSSFISLEGCHTDEIKIILDSQVEIDISALPARLINALKRVATFANPKFFELQRLRFSTWKTPRYIFCGELDGSRLLLPRGTLDECVALCEKAGARIRIEDRRVRHTPVSLKFQGELTVEQKKALNKLIQNEYGVLVAPPGAGKTVTACAVMAKLKVPVLVLVHRKQLQEQWKQMITTFLGISNKQIGNPGVKRSGLIDISTLQTLARSKNIPDIDHHYGLIIVDECHHGSAVSFEGVLKLFSTRVMLGLTATPFRKDGDQAIFHMQCGPIRHQMKGPEDSTLTNKRVVVRESHFRMPPESPPQSPIHEVWNQLILDQNRLELISNDIIAAIQSGQFPLVLSERKDHLERLYSFVQQKSADTAFKGFLLFGDMGKKERKRIMVGLAQCLEQKEKPCLFSTGSLIGEGFDLPELDTLILAMPISFKGRIIQYVGRINRVSQGKSTATVYDYVDINLGLTISMFRKRLPAYRKLGYTVEAQPNTKVSELIKRTRKINLE